MTTISPLLQNRLNNNSAMGSSAQVPNNRHEKIYQDLQKKAHEAKPNEAKAKMVNDTMLGDPIAATKDVFKDAGNFFKAVKTGEMGDNNLGRINDLGLKIGAALTATFLALHSKTKTEKIMKFVGGGTFIAAMSLWPKLFINLPARLVHGFRIDRKYISAQGDKKDFFLDNQFLVWDAYPEEQLRKDAKNAGIDYDSKNGKEKIQRKMQKTALQNRTLWMATAGFATPLITAISGNYIEPLVKKLVVQHDSKKALDNADNMQNVLANAKGVKVNTEKIKDFITKEKIDDTFFAKLEEKLSPAGIAESFSDNDNLKPILNQNTYKLSETLKEIYNNTATVETETLKAIIQGKIAELKQSTGIFDDIFADSEGVFQETNVDTKKSAQVLEKQLKALETAAKDGKCTVAQARKIFGENYPKDIKVDATNFKNALNSYVDNVYSAIPSRIKASLDLINPVIGSKAESAYTLEYEKAMERFFKGFNVEAKELKSFREASDETTIDKLSQIVSKAVKDDSKYDELLKKLSPSASEKDTKLLKGLEEYVEKLKSGITLDAITSGKVEGLSKADIEKLNKAILGADVETNGVVDLIQTFIQEQKVNINTLSLKPRICAEFERALLKGDIKLDDNQLKIARKMIYDGTISTVVTQNSMGNKAPWDEVADKIFNPKFYSDEIKTEIESLKTLFKNGKLDGLSSVGNYLKCSSVLQLIRGYATRLGNNKAWMKIWAPMSIALVAITLLAQPFFGKIDKEFPEENKNGGAK